MTGAPHVLVLPSWYPSELDPVRGVFFREQAQAVRDAGARVGVVAPVLRGVRTAREGRLGQFAFRLRAEDDGGIPTLRVQGWSVPRRPQWDRHLWLAMAGRALRRYVARHGRPDILHVQSALMAGWPASVLSRRWKVPYVVTEHSSMYAEGTIPPWLAPVLRGALRGADRVVAVSRALAAELAPWTGDRPIDVIPNLVDTGWFTLPPRPRGMDGPFRFLAVGIYDPVKGADVLLRAFAEGFRGDAGVALDVGGGGACEPALREMAASLGIAPQVRFLGGLTRAGVRDAMWAAHALVLPSRIETFGLVAVEAMATGLPVAATACGGPRDTVTPETGVLVPPESPAELAGAMRRLVRERGAWAGRAAAIRAGAAARFDRPVVARALLELYGRVAAEHGGRAAAQ